MGTSPHFYRMRTSEKAANMLKMLGAGEGNRTLVFSLGSVPRHSRIGGIASSRGLEPEGTGRDQAANIGIVYRADTAPCFQGGAA